MENVIYVQENNTYGTRKMYPANEQAERLCKALGGQKTITESNVRDFCAMGFVFMQVIKAGDKVIEIGQVQL